jgi:hypothetical protein
LTFCKDIVTVVYIKKQSADRGKAIMYTRNEEGLLNNYATEPAVYFAEYPSPDQQQRYALQGAIAVLLVTFTVLTAFAVS